MARRTAWTWAATILLTGLAGCVQAIPDDPPAAIERECCGFDPEPVPTTTPIAVHPAECAYGGPPGRLEDRALLCSAPMPPPPEILAPFGARLLWPDCDGCASVQLATTSGGRIVAATERGIVASDGARIEGPFTHARSPSLAVTKEGAIWYTALLPSETIPSVFLGAWEGYGDVWATQTRLDATAAPPVLLATRVDVAAIEGGLVLILSSEEGAWSVRVIDGAFQEVERITPIGGAAKVGAPVVDPKGRVLVPFAFEMRDASRAIAPVLFPQLSRTSLHYAALASIVGTWTTHGGASFAQGVTTAPAIEIERGNVVGFSWVDAAETLQRVDTWDGGSSWGQPMAWSDGAARVASAPSALRAEHRATLAWWEADGDGARLMVARSDGGAGPAATRAVAAAPGEARAPLAQLPDGRAVVAWVDEEGDVWAGIEGGEELAPTCGANEHCTLWRDHALRR